MLTGMPAAERCCLCTKHHHIANPVNLHIHRESSNICLFSEQTRHIHSYKTVQYKHASADTFNAKVFPAGLGIYAVMSMNVTLPSWLDLFQGTVCFGWSVRKKSPYDCGHFPETWAQFHRRTKAKQKRDQVPPSNKKKAAKTAITHKMKFALQFSALHSCCGFIATQTNL